MNEIENINVESDKIWICDKCKFKKRYTTGSDEYPPYTTIEYCSKGYWEDGDIPNDNDVDMWLNCPDFLSCV